MSAEPLSLPASLTFYTSSRANRNALDLIIRRPDLPSDLRWDEILAFHDAASAARRVQLDYFTLLYKAWEATWGVAKNQLLPSAAQPTISQLLDGMAPTVEGTWSAAYILNRIDLPHGCAMWSGVDCVDLNELNLFFYVDRGGDDYSLSDNLPLSADSQPVDAEHYRTTVPGLCPLKTEKADTTKLANASLEALDVTLKNLEQRALKTRRVVAFRFGDDHRTHGVMQTNTRTGLGWA